MGRSRYTMAQAAEAPKVSVIVTTYNRASLLPRAVASVLAQTYEDYELIVVDDCSTDDTPEVTRTFVDPRIRIVRHPDNRGHPAAVNTGIRLARGEYVAFLDDDDEWLQTKLSRQLETLDADPRVGLVYTWVDHVDGVSGARRAGGRGAISGDISQDVVGWDMPAGTPTYLVRTDAARQLGGFDETLTVCYDWDFMARLSMRWHVAAVPEVLVLVHGGHPRSAQWPGAAAAYARYLRSKIREFDRRLRERPLLFARLLRTLATIEMTAGNARGASEAYSKALVVDTRGTLRATVANVGLVVELLWGRIRLRRK